MTATETTSAAWSLEHPWLEHLLREHRHSAVPTYHRLWDYYRNELDFDFEDEQRPYRAAQEQGLPWRLTHSLPVGSTRLGHGGQRKQIVIENDIAWRIHALVDFMFGKPLTLQSTCNDPEKAHRIEMLLNRVFEANGGICFFQDLALLAAVYGFVDVLLRTDALNLHMTTSTPHPVARGSQPDTPAARVPSKPITPSGTTDKQVLQFADRIMLETVEAPRAVPVVNPADYRRLDAYMLDYAQLTQQVEAETFLSRLVDFTGRPNHAATVRVTEIWSDQAVRIYHGHTLVTEQANVLGRVPVVHIQNLTQPFVYEGLSEVEPLMPLQDELNTRLSDRANRVTFQCFKMYLGKGIEHFTEKPISPGQMWMTDNPDASIESFGGDEANPSEDHHIEQLRQAMDKTSAVTPLAAGLLQGRVGNLTSENALRVMLMGLLAKTERKRQSFGRGIEQLCEMILQTCDMAGVLPTEANERGIKIHWPSPLPENESQRLSEAKAKLELGVPRTQVLTELGYKIDQARDEP